MELKLSISLELAVLKLIHHFSSLTMLSSDSECINIEPHNCYMLIE